MTSRGNDPDYWKAKYHRLLDEIKAVHHDLRLEPYLGGMTHTATRARLATMLEARGILPGDTAEPPCINCGRRPSRGHHGYCRHHPDWNSEVDPKTELDAADREAHRDTKRYPA